MISITLRKFDEDFIIKLFEFHKFFEKLNRELHGSLISNNLGMWDSFA
jgi:hypothetical protein